MTDEDARDATHLCDCNDLWLNAIAQHGMIVNIFAIIHAFSLYVNIFVQRRRGVMKKIFA